MPLQIKAVIFDMDGLMFDTEPIYKTAGMAAAKALGYEVREAFYHTLIGRNAKDTAQAFMQEFGPDFPIDESRRLWTEAWIKLVETNGVPVKPGLFDVLGLLEQRAVPFGVATSTGELSAKFILDSVAIRNRFKCLVTGNMVEKGKPAPDIYLKAAQALNVEPDACIAFEDSNPGATAAIGAGMTTIVVPDLLEPTEPVKKQAYCILRSLDEAVAVLDTLL